MNLANQPASQPAVGRSGCFVGDKTPVKTRSSSEITHQARNHPKPKEKKSREMSAFLYIRKFFLCSNSAGAVFCRQKQLLIPNQIRATSTCSVLLFFCCVRCEVLYERGNNNTWNVMILSYCILKWSFCGTLMSSAYFFEGHWLSQRTPRVTLGENEM